MGNAAAVAPDDGQPATPEESGAPPQTPDPREPPGPPAGGALRVAVAADARAVVEGEVATFTVTATGAPSRDPVLVHYTVSGTARADSDYTLPSGAITLGVGAAQAKITIATLTDNESEPEETIAVALERASTATTTVEVDPTPATVTIAEPDTAIVSVAPASAQEGEQAAFAVTVSRAAPSGLTVRWKTVDGTAADGTDYTAVTGGTVVLGSGSTRQTIRVATLQDRLDEDDETFEVTLTGVIPSAGVSLGRATATGTIADDDQPPVLTIEDGDALEDAGSVLFRVLLAPTSGRLVTVSYRTDDDTATAGPGLDYTRTAGELTFRPGGPLELTILVPIADDSDDEPDEESFTVRLHTPVNAALGTAEATGTINDNDDSGPPVIGGPPRLDIADGRAHEGDGLMLFTVTLNRPSAQMASVFYETNDGTAETYPGSDYTKTEGELTFSPGGTQQQTLAVPIMQDDLDEGAQETFTVTLYDPLNAVLGDATAAGVIVDDDDAPADDHGNTRDSASDITPGTPISGRLETAADVDYFKVTAASTRLMLAATDAGRVGETGYDAGTDVRIETSLVTSTNTDDFDAEEVSAGVAYVRVSGTSATRYDLAVWLLERNESDTSFDIELRYVGTQPTEAQKSIFRAAADVWESVVTGDLARRVVIDSTWECESSDPSAFGDYIDDLRIDIRLKRIDGPGRTRGIAGFCVRRPGALPIIGEVAIDTADLDRIGTEGLRRIAVHEMAHVLGYGASVQWDDLLRNSAVEYVENNPGQRTLPDTYFTGQAARSAFNEIGGDSYTGGQKVPVENDTARYGSGSWDGHWREAVFDTELLTPSISVNPLTSQPLSKVTVASLADLGYSVDLTKADSYSLPSTSRSLLKVQSAQDEVPLGDDIRRGPVIVAEMPE